MVGGGFYGWVWDFSTGGLGGLVVGVVAFTVPDPDPTVAVEKGVLWDGGGNVILLGYHVVERRSKIGEI